MSAVPNEAGLPGDAGLALKPPGPPSAAEPGVLVSQSYSDLWRLIKLGNPSVLLLGLAALAAGVSAAATLGFPMLTKELIDRLGAGGMDTTLVVAMAAVLVMGSVIGGVSNYLLARVGHTVVARLRTLVVGKLLGLPLESLDRNASGDSVSRVVQDCESISGLVSSQAVGLLSSLLVLVGSIISLLLLDTRLTLMLLACVAVAFIVVLPVGAAMNKLAMQVQDRTAKLSAMLTHVFSEIRLVKAFTAEPRERRRSQEHIDDLRRLGLSTARVSVALEPIVGLAISVAFASILIFGAARVASGEIGVGTLTAYILYIFNITMPLAAVTGFFAELQRARGASTRISAILQERDEDHSAGQAARPAQSTLEFRDVSFAYPGHGVPVLRGLDLEFRPGSTTALVGISGSGKSTILSLIERFYAPTSGEVAYGGRAIDHYPLDAWRRGIGYVAQSAAVMPGSVRDNITYGLPESFTDEQVREAARKAGALAFIEDMPNGFETLLLEQGNNVSGGQRQRLAIARMFLRDPDILILDEATSSLDSETEHQVHSALEALMQGRTNIIVAHRLSTIMHADRIYFLESGRVSGAGKHQELIANHPYYARLVERQFQKMPAGPAVVQP